MRYIYIFCFIMLLAYGCKDSKIGISDGDDNKNTEEITEKISNIDAEGYKGLEDVFSNNISIDSNNKPIMLIFGNNKCIYCEDLKNEIKNNEVLKNEIKNNLVSYYINTSYSKNHNISYLHKTINTDELSRYYNLSNTPLVLFLEPNGNQILKMVGYHKEFFPKMVEFSSNPDNYKNIKDAEKRMQEFSKKYM